ncbi:GNAT family N-acetyltransferase [Nocardiopsis sp. HNM0947]|uniref:GNAT family N-acetyltransferase n=1 Tax=Nocardiopsis coralli TaxID=2772213 RepID=A0ABR9P0B6_9ACTN|nr:GNAT family N-acetyltransferase [Nocardiopsis coralli]MBE2997274.1 GNAT family N-acetyltransferase [Nocardiopsis coralli]
MSTPATTPDLTLRPAGPDDAGELFTLQRAAFVDEAQAFGDPFTLPLTESLDRVRTLLGDPDTLVLCAVAGARMAGSVRLRFLGPGAVLSRLAVAPDLRGLGIARRLLEEAEERARAHDPAPTSLTLSAGAHDPAQMRLYRSLGLAETSRERIADHLVMVHMRKEL